MKIYIASDHAGFKLKQHLIDYLEENGVEMLDKGPFEYNEQDDYPDWISLVAQEISKNPYAKGIVIGNSGQGEAIVANKFKDVRAGVFYGSAQGSTDPLEIIKLMREHNDCNVLSLGAKFLTLKEAEVAANTWIETQFSDDERHKRRITKIHAIDANN
jgi:ribose 5-phosphate isomerase B